MQENNGTEGEKKEKKKILQMKLKSENKCSITANGCKYILVA